MENHPGETDKLLARADALRGQGRRREAIEAFQHVLAIRPNLANAWFNLGYLYRHEGAYKQALHAYGQALLHHVTGPEEAHLNRAVIYADHLHQNRNAENELRLALAIAPDYPPALLNLGNLHEEQGQREPAIDCYERILAIRPFPTEAGHEALARLVHLRPPDRSDDPRLLQLQHAAESQTALDDSLRANLYFSLGRAHDAMGEYLRAFAAFQSGNQLSHQRYPPYDQARASQHVQALISAFSKPVSATRDTAINPAPEPVFICGMFRSGSTLLEQVLAAHPGVAAAGELDLLPRMVAGVLAPFPASVAALGANDYAELAREYHARMLAVLPPDALAKRYVTDKRPDNYALVGLIKQLFPRAKIIHTVRNPLDNALSVFMQHLNPRSFGYAGSLANIWHHFGQYRRLMAHWQALYPDDIHDFDYDAFVTWPEATLRPLFDFLGLDWHASCLEFHRLGNTIKTASYWQARRPLYTESSGRWRNYRAFLAPLREALSAAGVQITE